MGHQARPLRQALTRYIAISGAAMLLITGCSHTKDTPENLGKSIDAYYKSHPTCLWTEAVQFPLQEDASDAKHVAQYDTLVHQGLLVRSAAVKNVMLVASKALESYDLSSQGRTLWVADPQQPGYGNFCYGHRTVTKIDSSSPVAGQTGSKKDVFYRYAVSDTPAWATSPEIRMAFPSLQADLSGTQVGRATLTDTPKGWLVTSAPWAHISDSDIYE